MEITRVLIFLIVIGAFILKTKGSARGDQNQDFMLDEDIKEMTFEDLSSADNTETSGFDIVDEDGIDEELHGEEDQEPVKTNWMIVLVCCLLAFIFILSSLGALVLYKLYKKQKGIQVLTSSFLTYVLPLLVL